MPKVELSEQSWGVKVLYHCPGCKGGHAVDVRNDGGHPSWTFNGDVDRPTFTPSVLVTVGPMPTVPAGRPDAGKTHVCHSYVIDGRIQYLGDSTHELAGQTVDLPEVD